jgi:hypothetical protein
MVQNQSLIIRIGACRDIARGMSLTQVHVPGDK